MTGDGAEGAYYEEPAVPRTRRAMDTVRWTLGVALVALAAAGLAALLGLHEDDG